MVSRYCRCLLPPSVKLVRQKHVSCAEGCFYFIYIYRLSAFEYERFERYGCPEPGNLSDLVKCNSCQCDAKQGLFPGIRKEMVVLQNFEKGKR